jgi:hypothetical protein
MTYEHFLRCFIPKDPSSRFLKLFQVVAIAHDDILRSMALMLGANILLIEGFYLIVVGKMFL